MQGFGLTVLSVILGALPSVAWLLYMHSKTRRLPGRFPVVIRVFFLGCAGTLPALLLSALTDMPLYQQPIFRAILVSLFLVGPREEFVKLAAVWIGAYRSREFREPADGVMFAVTAALGFAWVENIVYLEQARLVALMQGVPYQAHAYAMFPVFVERTLFATPAHVMFSAMWGYSMGLARFRRERELLTISKGFVAATLLHGVYNVIVAINPRVAIITLIPLMLFMAWLMYGRIKDSRTNLPFLPLGEGAFICCPTCGAYTREDESLCSRCGTHLSFVEPGTARYCGRCRARLDPLRTECPGCGEKVPPGSSFPYAR